MSTESHPDLNQSLTAGARRILEVASELFYFRGIHAVGVDTIAAESGVTKRTLYDRFGSKDTLVATYLQARDQRWRQLVTDRRQSAPPASVARVLVPFDVLADWLDPDGRGCAFVNAFAELPEPEHPGHRIIVAEKNWLRALFHTELIEIGAANADTLASQLLALHEGAIVNHSVTRDPDASANARTAAETLTTQALHWPK